MRQLTRILLAETTSTLDEQVATPGDGGSYGELMDEIDRVLEQVGSEDRDSS
jgi:hypothetical protein